MLLSIELVAAVADNLVIGRDGDMPWHISADLRHFKELTTGQSVLMGRRTLESMGNKPLPKRQNLLLSRTLSTAPAGVELFHSPQAAVRRVLAQGGRRLMIIGGADLYREFLPFCRLLHLTLVHLSPAGDTFFPAYDELGFRCISREEHADESGLSYSFVTLEREEGAESVFWQWLNQTREG